MSADASRRPSSPEGPLVPVLSVPEIRDYQVINAEIARLLDEGQTRIRLVGPEGQRLLVSGLKGPWSAVVEVEGRAGPEFASDIDAPNLTIILRGPASDGVARGLRAGRVVIEGGAGDSAGFGLAGGSLGIAGDVGHRAGLMQMGGTLAIMGQVGRLAGDRQTGGTVLVVGPEPGPFAGHGRLGGVFAHRRPEAVWSEELERAFRAALSAGPSSHPTGS